MDFAVAGALKGTEDLEVIVITYDQGCGYSKNFKARFAAQFPHLMPHVDKIKFLVNKAHLIGHIEDCQFLFNPNYTCGCGRLDSEAPERNWSAANENAASTREMNSGARQDTLNDHFSWHNFLKSITICESPLSMTAVSA